MGWQDGLSGKGACYEVWWPEFNPQDSQSEENSHNLFSAPHISSPSPPIESL